MRLVSSKWIANTNSSLEVTITGTHIHALLLCSSTLLWYCACVNINKYLVCHKLCAALVEHKKFLGNAQTQMLIAHCDYETSINYSIRLRLILIFTLKAERLCESRENNNFFPWKLLLYQVFTLCTQFSVACILALASKWYTLHCFCFAVALFFLLKMGKLKIYAYITRVYAAFVLQFFLYALLAHNLWLRT